MSHPISCVISSEDHKSQRGFASVAIHSLEGQARVVGEIADSGLIVHGVTEFDVERAFHVLTQHFPRIACGKPTVAYRMGPPIMEPYYRVTVDTPEDCAGSLMADMSDRRGKIQAMSDTPMGKRFVAVVPVSECFGYATTLRSRTQGKGTYSMEFSHYDKVGGDDAA